MIQVKMVSNPYQHSHHTHICHRQQRKGGGRNYNNITNPRYSWLLAKKPFCPEKLFLAYYDQIYCNGLH